MCLQQLSMIRPLVPVITRSTFWMIRTPLTMLAVNVERNQTTLNIKPMHAVHQLQAIVPIVTTQQTTNTVHKHLAIKCGLSHAPQIPYYKYDPQSVIGSCEYKLYHDRFTTKDRTEHNSLDTTLNRCSSSQESKTRSTITVQLQKNLQEELIRISQLTRACIIPPVLSTGGIIRNKLQESVKLLKLRPALYILMLRAVILYTCWPVAYRQGGGGSKPLPRNSEGTPKSCHTQPDCENC